MRRIAVITALLLLTSACVDEGAPSYPPADRFYYPTAVLHVPGDVDSQGTLYVANSNWDGRYDFGSVMALDLDAVEGLPAFPAPATPEPLVLKDLPLGDPARQVRTDSFAAGRFGTYPLPSGGLRLFIPTRGERDRLEIIDANVPGAARAMACFAPSEADPSICSSPSLSAAELDNEGHPRATNPTAVAVDQASGRAWVTHRFPATDPLGTDENPLAFLVELPAANPTEETAVFHPLNEVGNVAAGVNAIALGQRYAFLVSAFSDTAQTTLPLLRLVDLTNLGRGVLNAQLELDVDVLDGRDIAISSDGTRLYIVTRFPDLLLVVQLRDATSSFPGFEVIQQIPLPKSPNTLHVLPRAGRADLLAVTCEEEDTVTFFDPDSLFTVNQVANVGNKPFGLTSHRVGAGARFFITNFADGQVAVLDMPDLADPREVRFVARLGKPQSCLITETEKDCVGEN